VVKLNSILLILVKLYR